MRRYVQSLRYYRRSYVTQKPTPIGRFTQSFMNVRATSPNATSGWSRHRRVLDASTATRKSQSLLSTTILPIRLFNICSGAPQQIVVRRSRQHYLNLAVSLNVFTRTTYLRRHHVVHATKNTSFLVQLPTRSSILHSRSPAPPTPLSSTTTHRLHRRQSRRALAPSNITMLNSVEASTRKHGPSPPFLHTIAPLLLRHWNPAKSFRNASPSAELDRSSQEASSSLLG